MPDLPFGNFFIHRPKLISTTGQNVSANPFYFVMWYSWATLDGCDAIQQTVSHIFYSLVVAELNISYDILSRPSCVCSHSRLCGLVHFNGMRAMCGCGEKGCHQIRRFVRKFQMRRMCASAAATNTKKKRREMERTPVWLSQGTFAWPRCCRNVKGSAVDGAQNTLGDWSRQFDGLLRELGET